MRKSNLRKINGFTKIETLAFIRMKLQTDPRWAKRACQKIFNFQTVSERNNKISVENNGVGFNKVEAPLLSAIASRLNQHNKISDKDLSTLLLRMEKYAKQVYFLSDKKKLKRQLQIYYHRSDDPPCL